MVLIILLSTIQLRIIAIFVHLNNMSAMSMSDSLKCESTAILLPLPTRVC